MREIPIWEYHIEDHDVPDHWSLMKARDPQTVAELVARDFDYEDCALMNGAFIVVQVRNPKTRQGSRWTCTGEALPHYYIEQAAA